MTNKVKDRILKLKNKNTNIDVASILESLLLVVNNVKEEDFSEIVVEKLTPFKNDRLILEFIANENRFISLNKMGIHESISKILENPIVKQYPHVKNVLNSIKIQSENKPDYMVLESYLSFLNEFKWDSQINFEYDIFVQKRDKVYEDILCLNVLSYLNNSKLANLYKPIIEKIDTYFQDKTTVSRKQIIDTITKMEKMDVDLQKINNDFKVLENREQNTFNLLHDNSKSTIHNVYGPVHITENAVYGLINGQYYRLTNNGNKIESVSEEVVNKISPSLTRFKNLLSRGVLSYGKDGEIYVNFVKDSIKIVTENKDVYLNGNKTNIESIKHKMIMEAMTNRAYNIYVQELNFVYENIDCFVEYDFAKTISSLLNEGVFVTIMKTNEDILVNKIDISKNDSSVYRFTRGNKLKNFIKEHLNYDISESFKDLLSKEDLLKESINSRIKEVLNTITEYNSVLEKIKIEKESNLVVAESTKISKLENSIISSIKTLQEKYNNLKNQLNEIDGSSSFEVGDAVESPKGVGYVVSYDSMSDTCLVQLKDGSNTETFACKEISKIQEPNQDNVVENVEININVENEKSENSENSDENKEENSPVVVNKPEVDVNTPQELDNYIDDTTSLIPGITDTPTMTIPIELDYSNVAVDDELSPMNKETELDNDNTSSDFNLDFNFDENGDESEKSEIIDNNIDALDLDFNLEDEEKNEDEEKVDDKEKDEDEEKDENDEDEKDEENDEEKEEDEEKIEESLKLNEEEEAKKKEDDGGEEKIQTEPAVNGVENKESVENDNNLDIEKTDDDSFIDLNIGDEKSTENENDKETVKSYKLQFITADGEIDNTVDNISDKDKELLADFAEFLQTKSANEEPVDTNASDISNGEENKNAEVSDGLDFDFNLDMENEQTEQPKTEQPKTGEELPK